MTDTPQIATETPATEHTTLDIHDIMRILPHRYPFLLIDRVTDLVRMKLNLFRDKDRVHVRALDAVGLITPELEQGLSMELRSRLQHVRATE